MSEGVSGSQPLSQSLAAQLARTQSRQQAQLLRANQLASARTLKADVAEGSNPFASNQRIEAKALQQRRTELAPWQQAQAEQKVSDPEQSMAMAGQRERNNPEMTQQQLMMLRNWVLSAARSPEEILAEILRYFPDPAIADEVLEYLIQTTSEEAATRLAAARALLKERFKREVAAGRNMGTDSRTFGNRGIGNPSELRALYLNITEEMLEHNALFEKLSKEYAFPELREVAEFLLKSLGSDLRSEGPSISRGKLYRLVTEIRMLQSILGIYNFFLRREGLVNRQFTQYGLAKPANLNFEAMAKGFMKLVEDRYPTAVKLLRLAKEWQIEEEVAGQIAIFSQFRDAVRGVSPRIYRTLKHRYDLLTAIIEALEELENMLEEAEEEEEEEEKEEEER